MMRSTSVWSWTDGATPFAPTKIINGRKCCSGSFSKAGRKGGKYTDAGYRYLCPICDKHFSKDSSGRLYLHGYKAPTAPKKAKKLGKPYTTCAECGRDVYDIDYLCETCRG